MKQNKQRKSIAWFKLTEYISRGEKERALGLYRLLSHTLESSSFELQLAGDILLACNDTEQAIDAYMRAADVYEQEKKYAHACGIYEHILLLSGKKEYALKRAVLAAYMYDEEYLGRYICSTEHNTYEALHLCIDALCARAHQDIHSFCWQASTIYALKHDVLTMQDMQTVGKKTIDILSTVGNTLALEKFLARMHGLNPSIAQYVREHIPKM